jgi:periplasmic protein TonB
MVHFIFPVLMKTRLAIFLAAGLFAGCASRNADHPAQGSSESAHHAGGNEFPGDAASTASSIDGYKRDLALRICHVNASKVFAGRPQALLRSVIVLRYTVDARGHLLRSEVMRSNHDREAETTALATLRNSAPFPQPASHLLRHGKLELAETWLFNNDGRFQLRSIAEAQMDQ